MAEDQDKSGGLTPEERKRLSEIKNRAISGEFAQSESQAAPAASNAQEAARYIPPPPQTIEPAPPVAEPATRTSDTVLIVNMGNTRRATILGGVVGAIAGFLGGFVAGRNTGGNPETAIGPQIPNPLAPAEKPTPTPLPTVTPLSAELGFSPFRDLVKTKELKWNDAAVSLEKARELPFKLEMDNDARLMQEFARDASRNKISRIHLGILPKLNIGANERYSDTNLRDLRIADSVTVKIAEREDVQIDFINRRTADDYFIFAMLSIKRDGSDTSVPLNLRELSDEQIDRINRGLSTGVLKQYYSQTLLTGVTDSFKTEPSLKVGGDPAVAPSLRLVG